MPLSQVRESAKASAATFNRLPKDEWHVGEEEGCGTCHITQQSSLAMANNYVNNPFAHQERANPTNKIIGTSKGS
jgi:hypothetical protein